MMAEVHEPDEAVAIASPDALPDDVLRILYEEVLASCERSNTPMRFVLNLFATNHRLRAFASMVVERLSLSRRQGRLEASLLLPPTSCWQTFDWRHASFLAPHAWAARFSRLRALSIADLSWNGAARLLTLLPAWRELEELDLRFEYESSDCTSGLHAGGEREGELMSSGGAYQLFANDLAASLQLGALPRLRYLFIGNFSREHCFGQMLTRGSDMTDDTVVLEQLPPTGIRNPQLTGCWTASVALPRFLALKSHARALDRVAAALWWMAERAQHVRKSKLHQWRYELEHGADTTWRPTLLNAAANVASTTGVASGFECCIATSAHC